MRSTVAVDIAAPARLVFDLVRDVQRWPVLLPHYLDVDVLERHADGALTARMVALRAIVRRLGYGLPVAWRARTWAVEPELRLRFVHRGGATDGMDVTWRIEETDTGCHVAIEHTFEPPVPGWAAFVTEGFVRPIATRTLATFRALAEVLVLEAPEVPATAPASVPRRSARPRAAKRSI
jgi:ribosome-associated toxin RatA of RatAB toxin-antitoxin module